MRPLFVVAATVCWFTLAEPAAAQNWTEFRSIEGGFRIDMPGKPYREDRTVSTSFGPVVNHMFIVGNERLAYSVQYGDFPASFSSVPVDTSLDNIARAELKTGKLGIQKSIAVSALPARRLTGEANDDAFVFHSLIVRKGNRIIQVIHTVRPNLENQKEIDRFFSSFALID